MIRNSQAIDPTPTPRKPVTRRCACGAFTLTNRHRYCFDCRVAQTEATAGAGYFLDKPPVLAVATGGKPFQQWFEILVHEYCHACQWMEGKFIADLGGEMWEWLSGKDLPGDRVEADIKDHLRCEHDCERRALALMRKGLTKRRSDRYAQKCNAYLYFYRLIWDNRTWYADSPPYNDDEVLDLMPTDIHGSWSHYWRVPKWVRTLMEANRCG